MVRAVEQRDLDVDQRVAGEHAELHGLLAAGVHRRDVLARDAATGDVVDELVAAVAVAASGLEVDDAPCAYWPDPPVCFLCVYSIFSTVWRMVSR